MLPWVLLLIQAMLLVAGARLFARHVAGNVERLRHPELITDVWAPLAAVLPMLFAGALVVGSVGGVGWLAIGAPALAGVFGVGCGLMAATPPLTARSAVGSPDPGPLPPVVIAGAAIAGLILLLLGAAHVLSVWVAQFAFALGAILLWINTPEHAAADDRPDEPGLAANPRADWLAGGAMMVVLICAAAQGGALLLVGEDLRPISAGLALAWAGALIVLTARRSGAAAGMRTGLVCGGVGVLMGIGTISLVQVVPRLLELIDRDVFVAERTQVAYGFGAYAFEAAALLVIALLAGAAGLLRREYRWMAGAAVVLVVVAAAALRLPGL